MRTIRNSNVAVVGGAGFLGSHLVNHLIEDRGCQVLVIDNLCAGHKKFIHKDATFEHHDITGSEEHLKDIFAAYQSQYVFNYAAWPYVPNSYERPLHVCNVNFMGALKVINAAQEAGVDAILQVSSAEVYGDERCKRAADAWGKINEQAPITPRSSYGASKAAIDALIPIRWQEARTPCIALRQFNCVGERETHPYVVPEIISQLHQAVNYQDPPTVKLGNNSARDFLYAGDAVRLAVLLLERGTFGEVYNLGSEKTIMIYPLAALIGTIMGHQHVRVEVDQSRLRPWEIWHLQSDNTKIYRALGENRPLVPLKDALTRTVEYFHQNNNRWDWQPN